MATSAVIEGRNLVKIYPNSLQEVFDQFSFRLRPKEIMVLRGPNGSGKTTLLRILAGLLTPSSGEVFFFGKKLDPKKFKDRLLVGYVPCDGPGLVRSRSARDNLEFYGKLFGLREPFLKNQIQTLAKKFKVSSEIDRPVQELSSGYRKRFLLLRAFLHEPSILLLDEPFNPLDSEFKDFFTSYLREYVCTNDAVAIVCDHSEENQKLVYRPKPVQLTPSASTIHFNQGVVSS